MAASLEFGASVPTLTRKREMGPVDIGAREPITRMRLDAVDGLSTRQGLLPLPLAGEGWGGGRSIAGAAL
jgi:hypothetical protein